MDNPSTPTKKRPRAETEIDDEPHFSGESPSSSLEGKRLRLGSAEDFFYNILDDDDDDSGESPATDDGLASVMRSLEQEIGTGTATSSVADPDLDTAGSVQELGYLLEASDDELGLPPTAEVSPAATGEISGAAGEADDVDARLAVYGQMWGLEDEIGTSYESFSLDLGVRSEAEEDGLTVGFDDGALFDYSEPSDLTWRSMPAV